MSTQTITVVGCGFLGSIFADEFLKLKYAGEIPGALRLVDFDDVDERNPANQNFTLKDQGRHKSHALGDRVEQMRCALEPCVEKLLPDNAHDLLRNSRLIVDAVDNLATRQLLWSYARRTGTPVMHLGMSLQGEGKVEWTTKGHDTFSLSPAALRGETPEDPPSGQDPPCELVRFRPAGLLTGYYGALAASIFCGFDPLAVLEGKDPAGWMTDWLLSAESVTPRRATWATVDTTDSSHFSSQQEAVTT